MRCSGRTRARGRLVPTTAQGLCLGHRFCCEPSGGLEPRLSVAEGGGSCCRPFPLASTHGNCEQSGCVTQFRREKGHNRCLIPPLQRERALQAFPVVTGGPMRGGARGIGGRSGTLAPLAPQTVNANAAADVTGGSTHDARAVETYKAHGDGPGGGRGAPACPRPPPGARQQRGPPPPAAPGAPRRRSAPWPGGRGPGAGPSAGPRGPRPGVCAPGPAPAPARPARGWSGSPARCAWAEASAVSRAPRPTAGSLPGRSTAG
jgi:hypothetical protein